MLSRKKAPKKDKNAFAIERIPLLQVYFSHFIAKQGTIFKDICFKQGAQFCSARSSVVWFTMDLQTSHLENRYHARVILLLLFTMKVFRIFFQINFSKKLYLFSVRS